MLQYTTQAEVIIEVVVVANSSNKDTEKVHILTLSSHFNISLNNSPTVVVTNVNGLTN